MRLINLEKLFHTALSRGVVNPRFRAKGLMISTRERHKGNLWVQTLGHWEKRGRIVRGIYLGAKKHPEILEKLLDIDRDPRRAADLYSRDTLKCSCCNHNRAELDPVCGTLWGLRD